MYIEGILFVQSTEMEEEFSACIYKNNVVIREQSLCDVKTAHTHVKCFV